MAISDGDAVNAAITNAAFMYKNVIESTATADSTSTGAAQSVTVGSGLTIFTNASLSSIQNITYTPRVAASVICLKNGTGSALTLVNNSGGTAANRILTGTGVNMAIANGAGVVLMYDTSNTRWQVVSQTTFSAHTQQILTSSGTYTTPSGCRSIKVMAVGGGGAGGGGATGGSSSAAGAGGGGGAFLIKYITSPSATYSYGVGAGGTVGSAGSNSGNNGGDTTFGTLTAAGGSGGTGGAARTTITIEQNGGGGGGTATNGDINVNGQTGAFGWCISGSQAAAGAGGSSVLGIGGYSVGNTTSAGNSGTGYGAGGSGGVLINAGSSQTGSAGTAGTIVVEEFY